MLASHLPLAFRNDERVCFLHLDWLEGACIHPPHFLFPILFFSLLFFLSFSFVSFPFLLSSFLP